MNFASKAFAIFLPIVLLGYYLLPTRSHKYRFLLVASWFFYMSWNPWFLWVIVLTGAVDYVAGILIEDSPGPARRKFWLAMSIVTNLGFLAVFKYLGFAVANSLSCAHWLGWDVPDWTVSIILPLGISFHTFQGISYTVDVYRNKIPAVRSFVDFSLFVAFFPQLVAGPIVRAVEFLPQLATPPRARLDQVVEGLHWFLLGLFKKLFLADRLAQFVDPVFADPTHFDAFTHIWAALAYAAQIYCDFSGYSDMAIGCAKWFGFELPQNFNFPYLAGNIADFWRRWHISLSTWIRDYVYFSFGGSRQGNLRTYRNLLVTMTLCGLWHGAEWNFVFWGFYNGLLLVLHRIYDDALTGKDWADWLRASLLYRGAAVLVTLWLVTSGFVHFRAQSWESGWMIQRSLLGLSADVAATPVPGWLPMLIGLVAAGHLVSGLQGLRCAILTTPPALRAGLYVASILLLVVFGPGTTRPFIYFQF